MHALDDVLWDLAAVLAEELLKLLLVLGAHLQQSLLLLLVVGVDLVVRVALCLLQLHHLLHELGLLGELRVLTLLGRMTVPAAVSHLGGGHLLLHAHAVLVATVAHCHTLRLRHALPQLVQLLSCPR